MRTEPSFRGLHPPVESPLITVCAERGKICGKEVLFHLVFESGNSSGVGGCRSEVRCCPEPSRLREHPHTALQTKF